MSDRTIVEYKAHIVFQPAQEAASPHRAAEFN